MAYDGWVDGPPISLDAYDLENWPFQWFGYGLIIGVRSKTQSSNRNVVAPAFQDDTWDDGIRARVVTYLESRTAGGLANLSADAQLDCPMCFGHSYRLSHFCWDDAWLWPGHLAHLVEKHLVRLPRRFEEHIQRHLFRMPTSLMTQQQALSCLDTLDTLYDKA